LLAYLLHVYSNILKRFCVLTLFILSIFKVSAEKKALIIAIGNYPNPEINLWPPIASNLDVPFIQKALERQNFSSEKIELIQDEQATITGLRNTLSNFAKSCSNGDVVVIHVSSHGVQIQDVNGDESDGLDEAIVPFGARWENNPNELEKLSGEYLLDDEWNNYIKTIQSNIGITGNLLVLMDACHSGTMSRGPGMCAIRGANAPIVNPSSFSQLQKKNPDNTQFTENWNADINKGTYVVISASQAHQTNSQCWDDSKPIPNQVGSLSYCFSKALLNLEGATTYQGLFDKIQVAMQEKVPSQNPCLEGSGQNNILFSGQTVSRPNMLKCKVNEKGSLYIEGGKMAGVTEGSKLLIFPSFDSRPDKDHAIDTAIIKSSENFSAEADLMSSQKVKEMTTTYAFVVNPNYGDGKVKVNIKSQKGQNESEINNAIASSTLAEISNHPDLLILEKNNKWELEIAGNNTLFRIIDKTPQSLQSAIKAYGQYMLLKNMEESSDQLRLEITPVPRIADRDRKDLLETKRKNGNLVFKAGDSLRFEVNNPTDKDLFLNIIDLQPDGIINILLPDAQNNIPIEKLRFPPGSSQIIPYTIRLSPPYGQEIIKFVITQTPIDLKPIIQSRGTASRGGVISAFENAFQSTYLLKRGAEIVLDKSAAITSLTFSIEKK